LQYRSFSKLSTEFTRTAAHAFIPANAENIHRAIHALFSHFHSPFAYISTALERLAEPLNDRTSNCTTHTPTFSNRRDDCGGRLCRRLRV
jgi:hypothetical protein